MGHAFGLNILKGVPRSDNQDKMDPAGKVAFITGAADGIGIATAKVLLKSGANVAICDVDKVLGKEREKQLTEEFGAGRALFIHMDVTNEAEFEGAINTTKSHFKRLDIVVNNAGIIDEVNWERCIDINLKGVIRGTLLGLKHLEEKQNEDGRIIVNIASIVAVGSYSSMPIYTSSKHGVLGLSASFGTPFHYKRTGVRVVAVCPGATKTELWTKVKNGAAPVRFMNPEDASQPILHATPDDVAKSILRIIREAESGTVWVSEGNDTYPIQLKSHQSMRVTSS